MPQYLFCPARPFQPAFAITRAELADDAAAVAHVYVLADDYPQAATITVLWEGHTVARVPVQPPSGSADSVRKCVHDCHVLIDRSRQLLKDTGPRPLPDVADVADVADAGG